MIKLKDKNNKYYWIGGTTALQYRRQAMDATGKKRMCKSVYKAIKSCAYVALHTALSCIDTPELYSVEGKDRFDKIINVKLPVCIQNAIEVIKRICVANGRQF